MTFTRISFDLPKARGGKGLHKLKSKTIHSEQCGKLPKKGNHHNQINVKYI